MGLSYSIFVFLGKDLSIGTKIFNLLSYALFFFERGKSVTGLSDQIAISDFLSFEISQVTLC
jgi:hypothetical protein